MFPESAPRDRDFLPFAINTLNGPNPDFPYFGAVCGFAGCELGIGRDG